MAIDPLDMALDGCHLGCPLSALAMYLTGTGYAECERNWPYVNVSGHGQGRP